MNRQDVKRQGPWMTEMVEGEPFCVGGRELVPLVRVTSRVRRQALVGSSRVTGRGWGLVRMQPVALLERSEAGDRCIPIQDETAQTLDRLFLAALIVPLLAALVLLARKISR
jgi:hypothetical protein